MGAWRCSECGCSRDAAERKRKRLGLRNLFLKINSVTCSPKCGRVRERRLWLARYGPAYWRRIRARGRRREAR